jgi:cyclopropane fatty-acyl-phospholipid synthase-like methyltransferase
MVPGRITMSSLPDKNTFASLYAGRAPWDIGKPQKPFVDVADQVKGSVLDAGCGTGDSALFFASRGHPVTGFDFLEEPIRRAQRKAAQRGLSVTFLVKDAMTLQDWSERFDSVIDCGLFHTFSDSDRRTYVAGLLTILKPGGKVFLMCFSDEEPEGQGPRRISQKELRDAFGQGWAVESIKPAQFEIIPEVKDFSEGGPKAWFAEVRRT